MPERLKNRTWTIRTVSPLTQAWDVTNLREIEHFGTNNLRRHIVTRGKVEKSGTYVTVEWISLQELSHHLYFEVYIADGMTAQVVLCCAQSPRMSATAEHLNVTLATTPTHVDSFAFCIVHGERKSYEIILHFLETTLGCVVGKTHYRPGSMHLAHILLHMYEVTDDECSGQVDITFGMPPEVQNLDEFSVSIPRTSFERLIVDFEYNQPDEMRTAATGGERTILFLKGIRLFILRSMHIDIGKLSIIRIANSMVMLGVSGKLKMLSLDNMHDVLLQVKDMMHASLSEQTMQSCGKRKRLEHSREGEDNAHDQDNKKPQEYSEDLFDSDDQASDRSFVDNRYDDIEKVAI